VDVGYDPLLQAEYRGFGEGFRDDEGLEEQTFDGKHLEELGFKPKSRVFRSVTSQDKEAVRKAVVKLRTGDAQMPMTSSNIAYYLSHHILEDRFNESESIYILSRVVAEQGGRATQPVSDEVQTLLNAHEEAIQANQMVQEPVDPSYFFSEMSPEDCELADQLMQMLSD
jgi:hypothetical protein